MSVEEDALKAELKDLRKRVESLESWAGNNSEQSTEKPQKTTSESEQNDQSPALTMDNLYTKTETESSAVTSTDGLNDDCFEDFLVDNDTKAD